MSDYKKDKEMIIERYNKKLKNNKKDDILSTGSKVRRDIRFKVLTEIGDFRGKRILDLGCGIGDFYQYLQDHNIDCEYTGYDINQNIVQLAKERFPDINFEVKDILEEEFPKFDYIVSTSSFNNRLEHIQNYDFVHRILKTCYNHIEENGGIAIDFLVSYVDYKYDYAFYYEPERVFSLSKKITRRVMLRNDYPLFEFAIYLYKDIEFPYG